MVKKYVISSGHGKYVRGAHGYIDEVDEARRVVNRVHQILKEKYDGEGYTFHDNTSKSQSVNLKTITAFHNSKERAIDISVHFNAASATATGVEVLHHGSHGAIASKLSKAMSKALGLVDRGQKIRKDLYVLKNTNRTALLLEVCFVSSKKDADAYIRNFEKLCQAIAKFVAAQLGYKEIKPITNAQASKPSTTNTEKYYKKGAGMYRIKKACNEYTSVVFNADNKKGALKVGTAFTVTEIVKHGATYRLKTKSKTYVTAKKEFVEKV